MLNPEFGLSLLDRLFRLVPWCTPYAPEHCQIRLAEGGKQAETAVARLTFSTPKNTMMPIKE